MKSVVMERIFFKAIQGKAWGFKNSEMMEYKNIGNGKIYVDKISIDFRKYQKIEKLLI